MYSQDVQPVVLSQGLAGAGATGTVTFTGGKLSKRLGSSGTTGISGSEASTSAGGGRATGGGKARASPALEDSPLNARLKNLPVALAPEPIRWTRSRGSSAPAGESVSKRTAVIAKIVRAMGGEPLW